METVSFEAQILPINFYYCSICFVQRLPEQKFWECKYCKCLLFYGKDFIIKTKFKSRLLFLRKKIAFGILIDKRIWYLDNKKFQRYKYFRKFLAVNCMLKNIKLVIKYEKKFLEKITVLSLKVTKNCGPFNAYDTIKNI